MRKITKDIVYEYNDRANIPTASVELNEPFVVETELSTGDWLKSTDDKWGPGKSLKNNPCACIYVNGAKPGDTLLVHIEDIVPGPIGHMALETYESVFPDIAESIFGPLFSETVEIANGYVNISPQIKVPIKPMIGVISTTIANEVRNHIVAGPYGGNLDVQEISAGATVYLPVYVEGALLNLGDVHARQSDGEISAVECRSELKLSIGIETNKKPLAWPRIVNKDYWMTVSCAKTERRAFELAFKELLEWICDERSISKREAYMVLAAAMEARCTVYLNPFLFTYICKINKNCFVG
ncbi:acetamidase/formamidase family protein [Paenibacillus eucommiae]|uniref:Acetamidase/formamidase n=1 Tax=Paenibacillus eucommiae TaxID=1355755 RepID=A0ABS4IWL9_9BACL|nr:acetamidase/formamidase family protein [Paenibacillus eucommiae]MBP1991396.1 acetamidase/formamidase [Paenibacillus eucommiae]